MTMRHFFIEGKVQNVWYRACTQEQANKLNITGWAKNLPDARVEVIACGQAEALDALEKWLWQGSPASNVTKVTRLDETDKLDFSSFEVI